MTTRLRDYDFDLPEGLIALRPVSPRSSARMLVHSTHSSTYHDSRVDQLASLLKEGDLLVFNDTRVIPARLFGTRIRNNIGAKVELTLLSPVSETRWSVLAKPLRKLRHGDIIHFANHTATAMVIRTPEDDNVYVEFEKADTLFTAGVMPLPPYIAARRPADTRDEHDYQTVFARKSGAIAAPTAALHFDNCVLDSLKAAGIHYTTITLHVGAGTFLPVKVDNISDHKMHAEYGEVSEHTVRTIIETKARGGRIIAVGTTALRLLETAARPTGEIQPWSGNTDIFITPGFQFNVADLLLTNFHLPKSTLMMLVSAFAGYDTIKQLYAHAIKERYRFYSYGDCCLLELATP